MTIQGTKLNPKKHKLLYLVMINLSGLHNIVYTLTWKDKEWQMWTDKTGDVCFQQEDKKVLGWNVQDGLAEYITTNKKDSINVLTAINIYLTMLRTRL